MKVCDNDMHTSKDSICAVYIDSLMHEKMKHLALGGKVSYFMRFNELLEELGSFDCFIY